MPDQHARTKVFPKRLLTGVQTRYMYPAFQPPQAELDTLGFRFSYAGATVLRLVHMRMRRIKHHKFEPSLPKKNDIDATHKHGETRNSEVNTTLLNGKTIHKNTVPYVLSRFIYICWIRILCAYVLYIIERCAPHRVHRHNRQRTNDHQYKATTRTAALKCAQARRQRRKVAFSHTTPA